MFGKRYNSEKTLKLIATILSYIGIVLAGLAVIGFIIMLALGVIEDDDFFIYSPIVLFGGLIVAASTLFTAHLVWGFGELVGSTRKIGVKLEAVEPLPVANNVAARPTNYYAQPVNNFAQQNTAPAMTPEQQKRYAATVDLYNKCMISREECNNILNSIKNGGQ